MNSSTKKMLMMAAIVLCTTFALQTSLQASVFNFTYTGTPADIVSGTLTTGASNPAGSFFTPSVAITGITGSYNGTPITGLLLAPSVDNILYYPRAQGFNGGATYLDIKGFAFSTPTKQANIYFGFRNYADAAGPTLSNSSFVSFGNFTVTKAPTAVPEPGSLGIAGAGLLEIFLLLFLTKRRQHNHNT